MDDLVVRQEPQVAFRHASTPLYGVAHLPNQEGFTNFTPPSEECDRRNSFEFILPL